MQDPTGLNACFCYRNKSPHALDCQPITTRPPLISASLFTNIFLTSTVCRPFHKDSRVELPTLNPQADDGLFGQTLKRKEQPQHRTGCWYVK